MYFKRKFILFFKFFKELFVKFRNKFVNPREDSKFFRQKLVAGNYLPIKDNSFIKWIDKFGNYQYKQIYEAIKFDESSRDVALDVGANVGIITRLLSSNCYRAIFTK